INTRRIYPVSRLVSTLTGIKVQRNKAIVGENAFSHEAGVHQDGVLKHRSTYEIMDPEDVGIPASKLVLGKHSGRHAFKDRLEQLGQNLTDDQLDAAFEQFKTLADKKKEIFDADLDAIIEGLVSGADVTPTWELLVLQTSAGTAMIPTATVRLRNAVTGDESQDASTGDGPIDAAFSCILRMTGVTGTLREYDLRALTGGRDAQGEVHLEIESEGRRYRGRGLSTDIIEASALAFIQAVNRQIAANGRQNGDKPTTP
ncbi:MAG: 2-isopropylmalate synthase, partial [Phycisphaerae bacterium]|nr:2-isopropylmalate synthase [Phycisphaerae bacterium]